VEAKTKEKERKVASPEILLPEAQVKALGETTSATIVELMTTSHVNVPTRRLIRAKRRAQKIRVRVRRVTKMVMSLSHGG
jgi:hypothetical protein